MDPGAFLAAFVKWTEEQRDVHALLLLGSRARTDTPADEWSDVDLALVVDEPDRYLGDERWVEAFGRPLLTFVEPTAVGRAFERRVLYEDGLDVDVAVFTPEWLRLAAEDPEAAGVIKRGVRVLVDRIGLADLVSQVESTEPERGLPTERELGDLASDFWYHALWAAKKLARGEVLMAKRSVDGYLKERLLTLLAWHAKAGQPGLDTWHEARFFERWADPRAVGALRDAYARYDAGDVERALGVTMDVFEQFERETAVRLDFAPPPDRARVRGLVRAVLDDQRSP
jgi:aminoglycoside 6-adenylyltransferase